MGDTFEALRNGVVTGRFPGPARQEPVHYEAPILDPEHVVPILTSLVPLTGGVSIGGVPPSSGTQSTEWDHPLISHDTLVNKPFNLSYVCHMHSTRAINQLS